MNHLLEFYGTECPCCSVMHDLVVRLKKEEGIEVESIEVWHNKENEKRTDRARQRFLRGSALFL